MSILGPAANRTLLSDWLPYRGLSDDGVVRLAGNGLMAVVEYRGPNFPITPNYEMLHISDSVARRIGDHGKQDGWTINPIFHNFEFDGYLKPEPHMSSACEVSRVGGDIGYIDAVRERRFRGKLYENRTYIAVSYRPDAAFAEKLENIVKKNVRNEYDNWVKYLNRFKDEVATTAAYLHDLMETGGGWARLCTSDEILSMYSFEIDGLKANITFPSDSTSTLIRQHVDARIVWGSDLYIDGRPKNYIRCVGIKGLPEFHDPEMLTRLRTLGFNFKLSQRFNIIDVNTLNTRMKKKLRLIEDSKHGILNNFMGFFTPGGKNALKADSMAEERAEAAERDIKGEAFARCGGYLTTTAVTWGCTQDEADDKANTIRKEMHAIGFKSGVEDANEFMSYIGSFPGVLGRNKRNDLLTEKFCAYKIPLSSPYTGPAKSGSQFGGPALMQCVTQGSMPFRFDMFSRTNGGGHTVLFGQNGSGKSTIARILGKQFLARFKPMFPETGVIDFDIDSEKSSSVVACLASGGSYLSMKHGLMAMQPLRDIEDGEARLQATFILRSIVEVQGFAYTARIGESIENCLNLLVTLPKHLRTMSMLRAQADVSELRQAVSDYCSDGPFGSFMDGDSDAFELSPWTLFEFGDIITKDARTKPIISSVLFRTQRALDGRTPHLMIIDEAKVLCMALGYEQLVRWLAECRKKLGVVMLCFHEIDTETTRSGITDVLMTQCDNKIFFPRGDARDPKVREWMDRFGVDENRANDLATATGRQILIVQGQKKEMVDLVLGKEELALCGVNGAENNQRAIELWKEVGPDRFWIEHLKTRGIHNAEQMAEEWAYGSVNNSDRWANDRTISRTDSTNIRKHTAFSGVAAE